MELSMTLPSGAELRGKRVYRIGRVVERNDYTISYLATYERKVEDKMVTVKVLIKEYFVQNHNKRDSDGITVITSASAQSDKKMAESMKDFADAARCVMQLAGKHANLVRVTDVFEANGTTYIVRKYLRGVSLSEFIKKNGPLGSVQMRELLLPIVDALAFLHAKGLTHGDINPGNILLNTKKDGSVVPLLIDLKSKSGFGDPTDDVYTMGVTMLQAATGNTTFDAGKLAEGEAVLYIENANIDYKLKQDILRALDPDKTRRYSDASALLSALSSTSDNASGEVMYEENLSESVGSESQLSAESRSDAENQLSDQPESAPELESEIQPSAESQSDAENQLSDQPESAPEFESEIQPSAESQSDAENEPLDQLESAPELESEIQPSAESQSDADNKPSDQLESALELESEIQPSAESQSDAENEPSDQLESAPELESEIQPGTESQSAAENQPSDQPEYEPALAQVSQPASASKTDAESNPNPKPLSDTVAGSKAPRKGRKIHKALFAIIGVVVLVAIVGGVYLFLSVNNTEEMSSTQKENDDVAEIEVNAGEVTPDMNYNGVTVTINGVNIDMVQVPGGSFVMGSDVGQSHQNTSISLPDFYLGRFEVTQKLWNAVMGSNPSYYKGDNLPVEQISWDESQAFIRKLNELTGRNFRMPTEAEWEYAARGAGSTEIYNYSGSDDIGRVAWYDSNSDGTTHVVGQKEANQLGIYDMSGNVSEWTSDSYSSTSNSGVAGTYRVIRGGGWCSYPDNCTTDFRYCFPQSNRSSNIGLRLAL